LGGKLKREDELNHEATKRTKRIPEAQARRPIPELAENRFVFFVASWLNLFPLNRSRNPAVGLETASAAR